MRPFVTLRETLWHENEKGFFTMPAGEPGHLINMRSDRMPYGPWRHFKKVIERKGDRFCVCVLRGHYRLLEKNDIRFV